MGRMTPVSPPSFPGSRGYQRSPGFKLGSAGTFFQCWSSLSVLSGSSACRVALTQHDADWSQGLETMTLAF